MTQHANSHKRLNAVAVINKAQEITGLSDFGDEGYRVGLDKFLAGLTTASDLPLTELGVAIMEETIVRFLVNRLRFESDMKLHPEILEETLLPPIVIMGLPRSGTTKLHRMMASDSRLQSLQTWQIMNPAPFPTTHNAQGRDPRIAAAEAVDVMIDTVMPEIRAGHESRARDVDEEAVTLMEMNFDYMLLGIRIESPTYQAWIKTRPVAPAYANLRKMLQYLQWQTGQASKPYLLKGPLHMNDLDALHAVFPGATLVQCHRDPKQAVTSFMRLAEIPRSMLYKDLDVHKLGGWTLHTMADIVDRNVALREALGERLNIIDVSFRDITSNPTQVIERIYRQHGLNLSPAARHAMLEWEQAHPSGLHGKFKYDMAHYGITPYDFDAAFSKYNRVFAEWL